jgi:multidrug efflux pump subunit AcrB
MGTGIAAVQRTVAELKLPPSIRVEYGGTYREQQKSFRDLTIVLGLAVVLIFLVLLVEFRSFTPPVAILASALLSTSGVFVALLVTRTTFNVSSFMGLIMVIGIVAKNGILLLDANEKFRAAGMPAEEAIIQAGRRRLRPIVMTALAAVAGMVPLALALGSGSQMLQPLAVAVIGGIAVSMFLSLIVTPARPARRAGDEGREGLRGRSQRSHGCGWRANDFETRWPVPPVGLVRDRCDGSEGPDRSPRRPGPLSLLAGP